MDIACSNFGEQTAIFGGGANLQLALDNLITQYAPEMIGVATTCLAETIGDDVAMFLHQYRQARSGQALPPIVHLSTPSYRGTHMQGFHQAVLATVKALARNPEANPARTPCINLFPGMVSPADLRWLKETTSAFGLNAAIVPDYSQTLDGGLWNQYHPIPSGGTPVAAIAAAGCAQATIELGRVIGEMAESAATYLLRQFNVPAHRLGMPMGIRQTDGLMQTLSGISGRPLPAKYSDSRGRLLDMLVDGHKYVNHARAVVYGEADLVAGMVDFLSEIGIRPVVCATGDASGNLSSVLGRSMDAKTFKQIQILEGADFVTIEEAARKAAPDLLIGHSKGYSLARKLGIPLVRIGFPVHDRVGGARLLHLGYEGAMALFDRITNTLIGQRQSSSPVGYTYM
jgi:nitrogenase molybdenum-iron protein NifN